MSQKNFNSLFIRLHHLTNAGWKRFLVLWVVVFALYLPAARAGFVADFSGWLDEVKNHSFTDNLNRVGFQGQSLYQLTQFNTWFFYKIFGIHEWPWHLLFITLHVVNCVLILDVIKRIFNAVLLPDGEQIAFAGVLLYSISPYLSETLVWEPSFHFLQGFFLILLVLRLTFQYFESGNMRYAYTAWIVYFLSTFSLEIFYITPWLVATQALFLLLAGGEKNKPLQILKVLVVPMLLLFGLHLLLFKLVYGGWVAHIGTGTVTGMKFTAWGKPLKYLFHLLFLGRFFSASVRDQVYDFCSTPAAIGVFAAVAAVLTGLWIVKFRKLSATAKVAGLVGIWLMISLAVLVPLWFQELQLVIYDRYVYFAAAWFYLLVALLVGRIRVMQLGAVILVCFALVNLRFTILVNRYWGKSARVISGLFHRFPACPGKTILLLNIPQNMNGVAMIGAEQSSEFKLLHDLILPESMIKESVFDCMAYNMQTPGDGAHVRVLNDSTLTVTLNQWGGWWWFAGRGGGDYANSEYRIKVNSTGATGLSYDLVLKNPVNHYALLYSVGNQWKVVDMNYRSQDQY